MAEGCGMEGNVRWVSLSFPFQFAFDRSRLIGDMVYVENFGSPMLFINSYDVVSDLLEKRSAIYSDRPNVTMLSELSVTSFYSTFTLFLNPSRQRWDWLLAFTPYGERWRKFSTGFKRYMESTRITQYFGKQSQNAHELLLNLLNSPSDYAKHIRTYVSPHLYVLANITQFLGWKHS